MITLLERLRANHCQFSEFVQTMLLLSALPQKWDHLASVRGHYVVCILFTYLVHYYITLPIPPRHTGYLRVDLILSLVVP